MGELLGVDRDVVQASNEAQSAKGLQLSAGRRYSAQSFHTTGFASEGV